MSYLLSHWQGKLPLGISLWVNTVGLLIVISYAELFVLSKFLAHPTWLIGATLLSLFFTRLLIFPWQLIGLVRAIERDFIEHKNILKTRALQALAVSSVLFTLVYSLEVLQGAMFYKQQLEKYTRPDVAVSYQLDLDKAQQQLSIEGGLEIGITSAVRSLLQDNPQIKSVVLQSHGGQIYEGRGLSKLFTEYGLDTYVYGECSSACTTAFIGGHQRHLGAGGKLGFHQYWVDTTKHSRLVPFYDLRVEHERDLALFRDQGIQKAFLNKMFAQPANQIWFPDHATLLDAQIIHFSIPTEQ